MQIRVADFIADFLVGKGIKHLFTVTGGGAMHLNDAFGHNQNILNIYNHHEQACAMAAEGYARLTGNIAAVCVTTGPGGTNAITGVMGAYVDSIPMLVFSGQVKYETTVYSTGLPLRQLGDQEFDIIGSVRNMTKYAETVVNPKTILFHLERAYYLATHGRKGPCWLDIPLDIQAAIIETKELVQYNPILDEQEIPHRVAQETIEKVLKLIRESKRPVIMAGSGIRLSGAHDQFIQMVNQLNIPVCTPWNSHDNIWNDHPMYSGRPGNMGERVGNFVVQNSDLLISIGSRLSIRQVSYNWEYFAREAYKVMVDIDPYELKKPTLDIDLPIHADAKDFINTILETLGGEVLPEKTEWLAWCRDKKAKYPVILPEYYEKKSPVNPYCFLDSLFKKLEENQVVVTGNGSACVTTFQAAYLKKGQRLFHNSGCASMGYGIPAAIGACMASEGKKIICLDGDGSFQMNLQELQTIVHNKLPIIIFLFNNNGYHSIRQTQTNFFGEPLVGVDSKSGVSFPDAKKIAYAYDIEFARIEKLEELDSTIAHAVAYGNGPFLCEVMIDPEQTFSPKLSSRKLESGRMISSPLEDMAPFLPREEFYNEMIIKPINE